MTAVMTIGCLIPECHGMLASRTVAGIVSWEAGHAAVCPVSEPQPLANVRAKLYDLEECDDPDYQDWKHRVDTEVMPLITVAAHLMVADAETASDQGPLVPEIRDRPGQTVYIGGDRRASIRELGDVLTAEFGGCRPGETSVRAAIRILREQRDQLAASQQPVGTGGTNA